MTGEDLYRRGYRRICGETACLRTPDGVRLRREQMIVFSDGRELTAGDAADRLKQSARLSTDRLIISAKRRQRKERRNGK